MKKIIYSILILISTSILVFNILSYYNIPIFGYRTFKVASESMKPYLNIGDIIIIKEKRSYKVNDVVTYKEKNETYVTHRIISMNKDKIITQGDSNNTEDDPISYADIVGKVIYRIKFLPILFSNPITWILIISIGTVISLLIPIKQTKKIA